MTSPLCRPAWAPPAWAVLAAAVLIGAVVLAGGKAYAEERGGAHRPAHTEPAEIAGGGGFVNSSSYEAGSYAFAVHRDGAAYLVTARHVAPHGATIYGSTGLLGESSLVSAARDTAYVRLAEDRPTPKVQIATSDAGAPVKAAVDSVAARGSITVGQRVCHSGYAETTQQAGGFACGDVVDVPSSCQSYQPGVSCRITMRGDGAQQVGWLGDSGGPVWQPVGDGRVRLLGVFTSVSSPDGGPATLGHFVPTFDVLDDLGGVPVSAA